MSFTDEKSDSMKQHADVEVNSLGPRADNLDPNATEHDHVSDLHRNLKPRHLIFISIGACIGTGIFLGVGNSLKNGGPLGLFLGYSLVASVMLSVMLCVGEMVTLFPVSGGHIRLMGRFVDPALSIACAYNYYRICWSLILAAEVSASAVLISYWDETTNAAVYMAPCIIGIGILNLLPSGFYGEFEFWFASIKVLTLAGLIVVSIIITSGGGPAQTSAIGFKYWDSPTGPFQQYLDIPGTSGQFLGFFNVLTQASFSLIGAEMLALAAAETRHPRKVLPTCIKSVWIRVGFFYITSTFLIGLTVPSTDSRLGASSTAASSPFVIAISDAGIKVLPSVINAAILTSALSAGCSDLFTTSRTLYSIAQKGQAPRIFARTNRFGVPVYSVFVSWCIGLLAFLGSSSGSGNVFNFLVNLTALSGILTWFAIAVTHIRFRAGMKAQGISRDTLPWTSMFAQAGSYWTLLIVSIVTIFSGWTAFRDGFDPNAFFSNYLPVAWFVAGFFIAKFIWKTKVVPLGEIDFVSGLKEIEAEAAAWDAEDELNKPTTFLGKLFVNFK